MTLLILLTTLLAVFIFSSFSQLGIDNTSCNNNVNNMKSVNNIISCIAPIAPQAVKSPFLFCVYHNDSYPAGNDKMEAPRRGNGADFNPSAPYRMYHGDRIPGFPQHPHRGFETVTVTLSGSGMIDHTDSLGNAGRYGNGDLQWMTAGKGIVHGEMFPLVHQDRPNPLRLMQIWLNLPKVNKMVDPTFVMHWAENIPVFRSADKLTEVTLYAGELDAALSVGYSRVRMAATTSTSSSNTNDNNDVNKALSPPPNSYAANPANEVGIYVIRLQPGGHFALPACHGGLGTNRMVYFLEGSGFHLSGEPINQHAAITVNGDKNLDFQHTGDHSTVEILVLQGRPINEPVAQYGPFVMNTDAEIMQAQRDYQRTQFGGWPWPQDAMVFPRDRTRFALFNGKEEYPPTVTAATAEPTEATQ